MKKIYINYEKLQGYILDIARQLAADNWRPDYVVGITRGGLLPAVLISQYLDVPMHTLKVTLRDGNDQANESNWWMSEDAFGYQLDENNFKIYDPECELVDSSIVSTVKKKNILIVDDINDTGATINWIRNDWESNTMPNSKKWSDVWHNNVKFATVVNNVASEQTVDYSGTEINKSEEPCWVVFPVENFWLK